MMCLMHACPALKVFSQRGIKLVDKWTLLYNRISERVHFRLYYTMDDSVWTGMKTRVD
ncbi:unnamed protein product [Brassica oleracea var. botrytis]